MINYINSISAKRSTQFTNMAKKSFGVFEIATTYLPKERTQPPHDHALTTLSIFIRYLHVTHYFLIITSFWTAFSKY